MDDEQIKDKSLEYVMRMDNPNDTIGERRKRQEDFIAGAHSRDAEINKLQEENLHMESLLSMHRKMTGEYELKLQKLRNPWISVEERLPEIEDEKEERTGEVFVCIKDGVYLVAHYSYFYKAWYAFDDRGGCMYRKIRTPRYWMSIPQIEKGE